MALYTNLQIYKAATGLLDVATDYVKNMPRNIKPILGLQLSSLCVFLVLLIARVNAAHNKVPHLDELLERATEIEILLRLCRDKKYISTSQYARAIEYTTSVGKQANGWKKQQLTMPPVT
jgi:hypothetical protein